MDWIKTLFVLISFFAEAIAQREFRYSGPLGPQNWPALFPTCAGENQSPIAISKEISTAASFEPFVFENFDVIPLSGTLSNNGHTAMVTLSLPEPAVVTGGGLTGEYEFLNYHFHWGSDSSSGSEHVIEGVRYPLELHMMFWNRNYLSVGDALQHPDGIAVFAAFYEVGYLDNPILNPAIEELRRVISTDASTSFHHEFRLLDVLPLDTHSYYRYLGSLTSPDCFESVIWTVFTSKLPISERQLNELRLLQDPDNGPLAGNFRPIQRLNSRTIYRNGIPTVPDFCFIPFLCPLMENFLQTLLLLIRAMINGPLLLAEKGNLIR